MVQYIFCMQIYLCVGALGKSRYHGFKVEVNEDVCCFDITMDDPRVACMRISIKKNETTIRHRERERGCEFLTIFVKVCKAFSRSCRNSKPS